MITETRSLWGIALLAACIWAAACSDDVPGGAGGDGGEICQADEDCPTGQVCEQGVCAGGSASTECPADESLSPKIHVEPPEVEFGAAPLGQTVQVPLTITNIGTCLLNVMEVSFDAEVSDEFGCDRCSPGGLFPMALDPFDAVILTLTYTPADPGDDMGTLFVVSDDPDFPLVRVLMHSEFKGAAQVAVDPTELDFGYVPVGAYKDLSFTIENAGTGNAVLAVQEIRNQPISSVDYHVDPLVDSASDLPILLAPGDQLVVTVTYQPQDPEVDLERVIIQTNDAEEPVIEVQLIGASVTEPEIEVQADSFDFPAVVAGGAILDFGDVPVGGLENRTLQIMNHGGQDLSVDLLFAPLSSPDFDLIPTAIGKIGGGGSANLTVSLSPSMEGALSGRLNISSNDATYPELYVDLIGNGVPTVGQDVIKVVLTFENSDNGVVDSDFRDVDLAYENPYGQMCRELTPAPDWGLFGRPEWQSFGPSEEPERIIHADAGMDPTTDGVYRIWVTYQEDCSSMPIDLLASILGISVDLLLQYLTGGLVGGIAGEIADIIANTCFGRDSTTAQVQVFINGQLTHEFTPHLGSMGDTIEVTTVTRTAGIYSIP